MTTPAAPQEPQAGAQPAAPPAETTPPWGADFDAEKAWKLVQNLRDENKGLKARPVLDDASKAKLAEFDKIQAANQTDLEKAQAETERLKAEAETWRTATVATTVRALAATEFADPDDAVRNLDPSKYLGADGTIGEDAIKSDLAALLESKPHYRRADGQSPAPRVPAPNPHQGSGVNGKAAPDPAGQFAAVLSQALNKQ